MQILCESTIQSLQSGTALCSAQQRAQASQKYLAPCDQIEGKPSIYNITLTIRQIMQGRVLRDARCCCRLHNAQDMTREHMGAPLDLQTSDGGAVLMCFTSGTSGPPKGVVISHTSLHCQAEPCTCEIA